MSANLLRSALLHLLHIVDTWLNVVAIQKSKSNSKVLRNCRFNKLPNCISFKFVTDESRPAMEPVILLLCLRSSYYVQFVSSYYFGVIRVKRVNYTHFDNYPFTLARSNNYRNWEEAEAEAEANGRLPPVNLHAACLGRVTPKLHHITTPIYLLMLLVLSIQSVVNGRW